MAKYKVLKIHEIDFRVYHVEVETNSFFLGKRVQQYRGSGNFWKLYPQGYDTDMFDPINDWLEAFIQQYEWSREHPK